MAAAKPAMALHSMLGRAGRRPLRDKSGVFEETIRDLGGAYAAR
jgi:hypothetical protein